MKIGLLVGREYSFPPAFIDKVNQLGQPHGITAEYVTLSGSPMDEPQRYKVIVDRISHEVEYYRGFLKLAVLSGTYVINNPFWWTADDKFFNYALAARLGSDFSKRLFNLVVTNVPGPQFPLYAAGARMLEMYPVVPLSKGQAVSIGLTSYDGGVYYGLNADRDAMPDVDVLAQCLEESLSELVETVR